MVEAHINSKHPKYQVTDQATTSDGNNALVRSYAWGPDLSGTAQGAGGVGGLLLVNAGSGGVHFPAYDLNGNVMGLVNAANGNISAKYEYGPFGEVFCAVGDMAKVNPFQFSTKYTDNETDFVYYGYRYYSPALGRWLSRDPIEEQGGLNLYGFVSNDPVNKWDRLGLQTPPSYYIVFPPEPPPFDEWIIDYGHLYPSIYFPDSIKTNIELCTRELEGSECSCDGLIVFAANIVSHHSFFRWPNKEDPGELAGVEIIGNEKDGKGPTKRNTKHELESKSCKTCYKNATYLEHGSGKWKLGLQATEQEIQNCLENRRMKGDYGGAFNNCNVWTRDAAIECGLNCY